MRGYSLIESLVAICIIGLVTTLSAHFTQNATSQLYGLTQALEQRLAIIKIASVITAGINAGERSRLADLLTITNGSTLQAPHGGPHPLVGVGATSKPRPQSSILSIIEVDPAYQGRIVESTRSTNGVTIKVCGLTSPPTATQFRSHLALGLGGVCQVTGTPQPLSRECFQITGTATRGLLHGSQVCPAGSYHEYVPVSRELSVFIDRSGEFRLVSHVGMRLLENQPLTRGLRELELSWLEAGSESRFIKMAVRGVATRKLTFITPIPLRRGAHLNEVLL